MDGKGWVMLMTVDVFVGRWIAVADGDVLWLANGKNMMAIDMLFVYRVDITAITPKTQMFFLLLVFRNTQAMGGGTRVFLRRE